MTMNKKNRTLFPKCLRWMRRFVNSLFVVFLCGLMGLMPLAQADIDIIKSPIPVLRHIPPSPIRLNETLLIHAVMENKNDIVQVKLWYRAPGKQSYKMILMTQTSGNTYEGRLTVTNAFKKGIEYYVEAEDQFGNMGNDGAKTIPYYVEVRETGLAYRTEIQSAKKPWWKNRWFWAGVVIVVGGGIAAATASGDDEQNGSGTVVVD